MTTDIVLATDGSDHSQRAARHIIGADLLPAGGTIHVVHVALRLPPHVSRYIDAQAAQAWYDEEAEDALNPMMDLLQAAGKRCLAVPLIGSAAQEIVRYADSVDAGVIVMGVRGRGAFMDAVVGSVASRVLALSKRPVLLVP